MSLESHLALLGDAPGLKPVRDELAALAALRRPIAVKGEVTTVRALVRHLGDPGAAVLEVFCKLLTGAPRGLAGALDALDLRRAQGALLILECDALTSGDLEHLVALARHRVVSSNGTPLHLALVGQVDPRTSKLTLPPGVFLEVTVPPLAARAADATWLLDRVVTGLLGSAPHRIDDAARDALEHHDWPGDAPELLAIADRLVARSQTDALPAVLGPADLGFVAETAGRRRAQRRERTGRTLRQLLDEYEKELIAAALADHKGNKSQVARELGISRSYLIQKCQSYGID